MTNGRLCLDRELGDDKEGWGLWQTEGRARDPTEGATPLRSN